MKPKNKHKNKNKRWTHSCKKMHINCSNISYEGSFVRLLFSNIIIKYFEQNYGFHFVVQRNIANGRGAIHRKTENSYIPFYEWKQNPTKGRYNFCDTKSAICLVYFD